MQEVQFPEITMQQKHKGKSQQEQHVYGRELQVSPSPADPSSRASRRDGAGRTSPEVYVPPPPALCFCNNLNIFDGTRSPKSFQRNSKFAFRIPMPMTTCSVEEQ